MTDLPNPEQPDPPVDGLEQALERVVTAARAHLAAVRASPGQSDDTPVWRSYVALNNASHAYDQLLTEQYGEVTPWDTEPIELRAGGQARFLTRRADALGEGAGDPYPAVVAVRQRRDFRVPSVSRLLAAAATAAPVPPETVAEAVLALVEEGGGDLDLPPLEPLAGVVTVAAVDRPLDPAGDGAAVFGAGEGERPLGRRDERPDDG